jgi:hypothetical protein
MIYKAIACSASPRNWQYEKDTEKFLNSMVVNDGRQNGKKNCAIPFRFFPSKFQQNGYK